jgi:hypothetical protein
LTRIASFIHLRYLEVMSGTKIEDLKRAIGELSSRERISLAEWMNLSLIRQELLDADRQISDGAGTEHDEATLPEFFAETRASALQLLSKRAAKQL